MGRRVWLKKLRMQLHKQDSLKVTSHPKLRRTLLDHYQPILKNWGKEVVHRQRTDRYRLLHLISTQAY
jgi:hypothetical protein